MVNIQNFLDKALTINKPNKQLNFNIDWRRNFVQLPEKDFSTDEIDGQVDHAFNPKLNSSIYAQWNTEDDDILVNYRINWIPKIGSWFYFVVNQEFDTSDGVKLGRTTIMGKLIWRFPLNLCFSYPKPNGKRLSQILIIYLSALNIFLRHLSFLQSRVCIYTG